MRERQVNHTVSSIIFLTKCTCIIRFVCYLLNLYDIFTHELVKDIKNIYILDMCYIVKIFYQNRVDSAKILRRIFLIGIK